MATTAPRRAASATTARRRREARPSDSAPIVIYAASSIDGTSFALDPGSQRRIREAFPDVQVSTRHVFIAHDTREAFENSIQPFEDQITILLTGVSAERLAGRFGRVSFRDPRSEQEIGRLPSRRHEAARQA